LSVVFLKYNCETIVYECDFDKANKLTACNGFFNHSLKDQIVDVFQTSNTLNTDLKYDVTDYTSSNFFN